MLVLSFLTAFPLPFGREMGGVVFYQTEACYTLLGMPKKLERANAERFTRFRFVSSVPLWGIGNTNEYLVYFFTFAPFNLLSISGNPCFVSSGTSLVKPRGEVDLS